jgi:UDP-N-acetylmuramoylalanine--D-glutamate ligase
VPLQAPLVQQALAQGMPVVSEIELFVWGLRQNAPQAQVIAITGSNGKTTTTALTGALCRAAGRRTGVAGNISPAALDALMSAIDGNDLPAIWVLELSSFQLEATHTLQADAATVLNISEDHLDRYAGMDDYAASKARVFQGQGVQVLNRDDARSLAAARPGRAVVTFGLNPPPRPSDYGLEGGCIVRGADPLIPLAELKLVGRHNASNAMAALALCQAVGIDPHSVLPALAAFHGLAHRVEWVAEINGVSYFDDSKGTNVGATLAAVQGLGRRLAIVLGGDGKGQDFAPLRSAIEQHARAVALIGRDAAAIAAVLEGCCVPTRLCASTWRKRSAGAPRRRRPVKPSCFLRPARAWTCIVTTRIVPRHSSRPFAVSKERPPDVANSRRASPPAFGNRSGAPLEHPDAAGDRHGHGLFSLDGHC